MCIRDRDQAVTILKHRKVSGLFTTPKLLEALAEKIDLYEACLLYTSDAADERSSVDLGGRRIIKKKNNIIIHHREIYEANINCQY